MQTKFQKMTGITLLEQLLALSVVAVIVIAGVSQYIRYQQQQQLAEIQFDLSRIFSALNRYFDAYGCQSSGEFKGEAKPDLIKALGLAALVNGRMPYVANYVGEIQKLPITTVAHKPLYQFIITATMRETLALEKMRYLLIKSSGYRIEPEHRLLQWKVFPHQNYQDPNGLSSMTRHLREFKHYFSVQQGDHYANCAQ